MELDANGDSGKRPDTPARMEGMVDLNLLPQRYRRRWPRPSTVLAWLLMFVLLGALFYSYQAFERANRHYAEQRTDLTSAREELEASDPVSEQIAQLRAEIEAERQRAQALERAAAALDIQDIAWGSTLQDVLQAAPDGLTVDAVREDRGAVSLSGTADEYHAPLAYAAALRELTPGATVTVESIDLAPADEEAEATAAPTATPSPDESPTEVPADPEAERYVYTIRVVFPSIAAAALGDNQGGAP